MITREGIIAAARTQLDVPYQHQASVKDVATDCIGLLCIVAAMLAMPEAAQWAADPLRKSYAPQPDPKALLESVPKYLTPVHLVHALPGDILLLRWGREPRHFAILTGDSMIHAYASAGKVVENRIDHIWRRRVVAAFRFKGL